jgi:peptidoglycan/xylan/chitin deacetylase (PgdA/CDA1 family)
VTRRFEPLVLCYHGFAESTDHELLLRPRALSLQLRLLIRRGFRPVAASQALAGAGRLLHVTFDDALTSVRLALPELRRLDVPATVFACTDFAESGLFDVPELSEAAAQSPEDFAVLGWEELRELADSGVQIGSHTCSHPRLTGLSDSELRRELCESKASIEDHLGRPCVLLAYPYGDEDQRVRAAAQDAGYEAAFSLPGRRRPFDLHGIPRVDLYRKHGPIRAMLKTSFVARR